MKASSAAGDLSRLKYELERFLLGGRFDLYECERLIGSVEPSCSLAEISFGKLILYCWGEGWSRSWRVIGCRLIDDALRLDCTKQMGRARSLVELRRGPSPTEGAASRREFTQKLRELIEASFASLKVERALVSRDSRRHLSGVYTRLVIKERGRPVAAIAVAGREPQPNIDAVLGAGLIWLDALRRKNRSVDRLLIFAPRGRAGTIATRLTALRANGASLSLYEVDEAAGSISAVAAFDQGDLADKLHKAATRALWPRDKEPAPSAVAAVEKLISLAPNLIEKQSGRSTITFSIRGLEFARASTTGSRVEFGIGEPKQTLDESNQAELERLITEIVSLRRPAPAHPNDFRFRAQPERWLESLIRRDITQIDPSLDARYVYSQVPAYRGEQRSFIDLLSVTRERRLAVLELKVSEDAEFPFQGLDYWLRVEWHRRRGDFQRRGYFPGIKLCEAAPVLLLVAPLFRFHRATRLIASAIGEHVPVYRVGINEDWRAGVRVLLTERLN